VILTSIKNSLMMIIWLLKHVGVILSVLVRDIWINVLLQTSALFGPLYILKWNAQWNSEKLFSFIYKFGYFKSTFIIFLDVLKFELWRKMQRFNPWQNWYSSLTGAFNLFASSLHIGGRSSIRRANTQEKYS
jgi:hypothetical protein